MNLTIDNLKQAIIEKKKYLWFDNKPNLIGIRTSLMIPDMFNDIMCVVWKNNIEIKMMNHPITTDPGLFYLNKPLNVKGTAILAPGQYIDCYSLGLHQGKADHPALVQVAPVTVFRDNNKDSKYDLDPKTLDKGMHGINIHRSNRTGFTPKVVNWSAGCQVYQNFDQHTLMLGVHNNYKTFTKNRFTYTLLNESDL
jgi:hypothetical protein